MTLIKHMSCPAGPRDALLSVSDLHILKLVLLGDLARTRGPQDRQPIGLMETPTDDLALLAQHLVDGVEQLLEIYPGFFVPGPDGAVLRALGTWLDQAPPISGVSAPQLAEWITGQLSAPDLWQCEKPRPAALAGAVLARISARLLQSGAPEPQALRRQITGLEIALGRLLLPLGEHRLADLRGRLNTLYSRAEAAEQAAARTQKG